MDVISHKCSIDVSLILDKWFVSHDITCKKCYKCINAKVILTDFNPLLSDLSLIAPNIDELYKGLNKLKPNAEILKEFTYLSDVDQFAYKLVEYIKKDREKTNA